MANKITVVISRNRNPQSRQALLEEKLLRGLSLRPGLDVTVISPLYDLRPEGLVVEALRAMPGDLLVLCWLYPRAAYWTLNAHGIQGRLGATSSLAPGDVADSGLPMASTPERTIWCLDLRAHTEPDALLSEIDRIAGVRAEAVSAPGEISPQGASAHEVTEASRTRWYPVIDASRCTDCLECLNFCLFGVYGLGPGNTILIEQPDACRPGCPACSRICPQGAIMFPQHADPAIAGDPAASLQGMKLDLSQLLSGVAPAQLAELERERALKVESPRATPNNRPDRDAESGMATRDRLDRLVDEVDKLDL